MIIRIFRPTIYPGKESEFESFLRNTAIPLVSQQSGLMAQHVGKPRDPSSTEYLYVTVWENVESIQAFAGERWEEAVITLTRSTYSRTRGSGTTTPSGQTEKCSPKVCTSVSDTGLRNACSKTRVDRYAGGGRRSARTER